ncbi:hypothetical protein XENTR_v10009991 [Xenopus tropicalis]|nr:hypothetical protein XENTR_v10009991 [Xenopus tropicalis]
MSLFKLFCFSSKHRSSFKALIIVSYCITVSVPLCTSPAGRQPLPVHSPGPHGFHAPHRQQPSPGHSERFLQLLGPHSFHVPHRQQPFPAWPEHFLQPPGPHGFQAPHCQQPFCSHLTLLSPPGLPLL